MTEAKGSRHGIRVIDLGRHQARRRIAASLLEAAEPGTEFARCRRIPAGARCAEWISTRVDRSDRVTPERVWRAIHTRQDEIERICLTY